MPTYRYRCDACDDRADVHHSANEQPAVTCVNGHPMRKDVAAYFPHVSLLWHKDQGIGAKLVLQSTGRTSDGNSGISPDSQ